MEYLVRRVRKESNLCGILALDIVPPVTNAEFLKKTHKNIFLIHNIFGISCIYLPHALERLMFHI